MSPFCALILRGVEVRTFFRCLWQMKEGGFAVPRSKSLILGTANGKSPPYKAYFKFVRRDGLPRPPVSFRVALREATESLPYKVYFLFYS